MTKKRAMKMTFFSKSLMFTALMIATSQVSAVTYNLCTGATSKTMPDGTTTIAMWGYGMDTGGACAAEVPGPRLTVPVGDATLTINLRNTLPEGASVIVPGLTSTEAPAPVIFTDAQGRSRARSFVKETPPDATTIVSYSFNARPGTFLYHSGSHPAVQVQMGLYGAVTGDAAVGEAYTGIGYDNEVVMLYSEIDPALHAAVDGGDYGPGGTVTSTVNYVPKYYLVNGEPYSATTADIPAGAAGQRTLVRFLNAGLDHHAPTLLGEHMTIVAEYGNPYPYPRVQYSMFLVAQQTRDAIIEPANQSRLPLYDHRMRLTNNIDAGPGGLMSFLAVVAAAGAGSPPTAVDDSAITDENLAVVVDVAANDSDTDGTLDLASVTIGTQAFNGIAVSNGDGTVTYSPNPTFNGVDSFSYTIRDNDNNVSNTANVSITVNSINDAPVAVADSYEVTQDTVLNVMSPGVLANDSDVDGDVLTAVLDTSTTNGALTLNADGSFSYTPNLTFTGSDSFTYHANDGAADSAIVMVTISVNPAVNQAPVANDDYDTVTRNIGASTNSVTVNVVANDTDSDGTVDPATVVITAQPRKGSVVNNGDGTITYTPAAGKNGSDAFAYTVNDNAGATSNEATVRISIVK